MIQCVEFQNQQFGKQYYTQIAYDDAGSKHDHYICAKHRTQCVEAHTYIIWACIYFIVFYIFFESNTVLPVAIVLHYTIEAACFIRTYSSITKRNGDRFIMNNEIEYIFYRRINACILFVYAKSDYSWNWNS